MTPADVYFACAAISVTQNARNAAAANTEVAARITPE